MRDMRSPDGFGLVQRQGRLPVPPRTHKRRRPRSRAAEERLPARGPGARAPARAAPDAEPGRAPAVASAAHPERRRRPTCRQPAGHGKLLPRERDRPRLRPDRRNLECRQDRYNRERHQESQLARASARERKEETLRQPVLRQHTPGWKFSMPADKRSRGFDVSEGLEPGNR